MTATEPLSLWELAIAAVLLIAVGGISAGLRLGIAPTLAINAARMAAQLALIGLVLEALFTIRSPWAVGGIGLIMLGVAGHEVVSRQKRKLPGRQAYGIGLSAMFVSSFALATFALAVVVRPDPWFDPRYAIPILGMLLGNTMSAIALSLERLSSGVWDQRNLVEQRLMLGQPAREAIGAIHRDALRSGLMPTINAMATAGLVSLPGMMTGQILAGNPPIDAVKYQILIFLLIAAGNGFGSLVAAELFLRRIFDERQRLRVDRLR